MWARNAIPRYRVHEPIPGSPFFSDGQVWIIHRHKLGSPDGSVESIKEIMLEDCVFLDNSNDGYFINFTRLETNAVFFILLDLDPLDFQEKILGYVDTEDGAFPYCKTEEDAIKLLDELILYNYNNYK